MKKIKINIATNFTITPGGRLKVDGLFSGELFREKFLEAHFESKNEDFKIEVVLDGVEGYPTSFLEEAFGGLARKFGKEICSNKINFISEEDKLLVKEIESYIEHCDG